MDWFDFISQAFELIPFDFFKSIAHIGFDKAAIKLLPLPTYLFWLAIFTFIIVVSLYEFYKHLLKARTIEDTPTAKIRSAAQGYTELWGTQYPLAEHPVIAPLSLLPCCWYAFKIYKKGKNENWVLVSHGESSEPFFMQDATGSCIVQPAGAEVQAKSSETWYGFLPKPQGKNKSKIFSFWAHLFGDYQYKEYRMESESPIYVLGYFSTIEKNNQLINIVSKNGLVARQPYLISNFDQKDLAKKYRLYSVLWLVLFLGIVPYGLWWVSIRL